MPNTRNNQANPPRPPDPTAGLPPVHLTAAGIDVGRAEPSVAVPPDRSPAPGRRVASGTADLQALADGLHAGHLATVVMARTGVDGIPLCHLLAARGVAVHVGTARHATHRPGRHTESADGQWRPTLPTCGLLHRAVRPTAALGVCRASLRPRETLLRAAATGLQPRPKALTDLHGQLAKVLRDISGVTGLARLRALLAGARDPPTLAAVTEDRLTASPHTIATSLAGHWRAAWRLTRRQSPERSACAQQNLAACDPQIAAPLRTVDRQIEGAAPPLPAPNRRPKNARRHEPHVDRHTPRARLSGVDVTRLDGLEGLTAQPLMAEIGLEMRRWKRAPPVAAWLG